jgi:hypothetical protein
MLGLYVCTNILNPEKFVYKLVNAARGTGGVIAKYIGSVTRRFDRGLKCITKHCSDVMNWLDKTLNPLRRFIYEV